MSKKTNEKNEIAIAPSEEQLAALKALVPQEQGFNKISLPRLGFQSQDKTDGKGKNLRVVMEAGTFYTEKATEEKAEDGKTIWAKEEIGTELEVIICYWRRQLKYYDQANNQFHSSNVYDSEDEKVSLFAGGKKFLDGMPEELKKRYEFTDENGKIRSRLEETKILYLVYEGQMYQLNVRGSSMWNFKNYAKKTIIPAFLTKLSSEEKENGATHWNAMTFTPVRALSSEEVAENTNRVREIMDAIKSEKDYYKKDAEIEATPIKYVTAEEEGVDASKIQF